MNTYYLDKNTDSSSIVKLCVEALLKPGAVLLLPTETVYGLVCRWSDSEAKKRIFTLKGRDENKPFQMMISSIDQLNDFGVEIPTVARKITNAFCPGPITILVPHSGAKVGYRIPEHNFFIEVLSKLGEPLAATSANLTGNPVALTTTDAISDLNGEVDIVVDEGILPSDILASTVVDVADNSFSIVRKGPITEFDIHKILE